MAEQVLEGVRVAALAADGVEQIEITRPIKALEKHGAQVDLISLTSGSIRAVNHIFPGKKLSVDRPIDDVHAEEYDALFIPGGLANPDALRQSDDVLDFVRAMDAAEKPIAVICHAPWVLISAGLVEGRRLTSWPGIEDDVRNAGATWLDKSLVEDENWISSRGPQDIRVFDKAIVRHFAESLGRQTPSMMREMGWAPWLAGAAAVAAATGFAMRRGLAEPLRGQTATRRQRRNVRRREAVEFAQQ